jgi:predicted nucleic acid-binding protein
MTTFLLDTSVIIDALNNKRCRPALLLELLNDGHVLACCPINVTEVYAGLRPKEEAATEDFLRRLQYFPITRTAGELKREHRLKGITLNLGHAIVAIVALSNQLVLLTDNVKDFPIRGLTIYPLPKA